MFAAEASHEHFGVIRFAHEPFRVLAGHFVPVKVYLLAVVFCFIDFIVGQSEYDQMYKPQPSFHLIIRHQFLS
ncbi:hypothetical protein SAMN05216323_11034 [Williamwhitmania taraxaci]|uniref:Uncharacterized protein n=1 Tax=Williamwhitmania taraxaci TaxID=1640674 RepID=A0A1G6SV78_9BACT|nr:hypothetical protein SAMN05216323_11034 [Williamwhitmania taraxaci]